MTTSLVATTRVSAPARGGLRYIPTVAFGTDLVLVTFSVFAAILGREAKLRSDGGRSPRVIFTDPQVGAVGLTLAGPGFLDLWRGLDGEAQVLRFVGTTPNSSTLTGTVVPKPGKTGTRTLQLANPGEDVVRAQVKVVTAGQYKAWLVRQKQEISDANKGAQRLRQQLHKQGQL